MNLFPAVVASVDGPSRIIRVSIPFLTDGAQDLPEAVLCSSLGDKSEHTEIRILAGDRVWVAFINGDPRYPIIMGFRPKEIGNVVGMRRFHHDNIELQADTNTKIESGAQIQMIAGDTVSIEAGTSITLSVGGSTLVVDGSGITLNGSAINLN